MELILTVFKQNREDGFDNFTGPYVFHSKERKATSGETIPESFNVMALNYRAVDNDDYETLGEYKTLRKATDVIINMVHVINEKPDMLIYSMPKE